MFLTFKSEAVPFMATQKRKLLRHFTTSPPLSMLINDFNISSWSASIGHASVDQINLFFSLASRTRFGNLENNCARYVGGFLCSYQSLFQHYIFELAHRSNQGVLSSNHDIDSTNGSNNGPRNGLSAEPSLPRQGQHAPQRYHFPTRLQKHFSEVFLARQNALVDRAWLSPLRSYRLVLIIYKIIAIYHTSLWCIHKSPKALKTQMATSRNLARPSRSDRNGHYTTALKSSILWCLLLVCIFVSTIPMAVRTVSLSSPQAKVLAQEEAREAR